MTEFRVQNRADHLLEEVRGQGGLFSAIQLHQQVRCVLITRKTGRQLCVCVGGYVHMLVYTYACVDMGVEVRGQP